ncbi:hypothetical protein EAE99_007115 [Botrytis elliptica]|nr:hypothetical protein EAE99_007115 [Botrytis elliptica]
MGCDAIFGGLDNIIHDTGGLGLALDKLMGGATYVLQPQRRSHGCFQVPHEEANIINFDQSPGCKLFEPNW